MTAQELAGLEAVELLEAYASGSLRIPGDPGERRLLEARLGLLRGHLDRLAALPRGRSLRVEALGSYAVAMNRDGLSSCVDYLRDRLELVGIHPPDTLPGEALRDALNFINELCSVRGVLAAVAGVDWDTGLKFVHLLPPVQAVVLAAAEELRLGLVRAAMGFHLHRWEPRSGVPDEGLRIRLHGDLVIEYAAIFRSSSEALDAAEAYKAFEEALRAGVEEAFKTVDDVVDILASMPESARQLDAATEWPSKPGLQRALLLLRRHSRFTAPRTPWSPGVLNVRVRLEGVKPETCSLSQWRRLRGGKGCALTILSPRRWGLRGVRVPVALKGERVLVEFDGDTMASLAAAHAAEASLLRVDPGSPGKVVAEVAGHRLIAEEALLVEAQGPLMLHALDKAGRLKEALGLKGEPLRLPLSYETAALLLEAAAIDVQSHVLVLPRPQRVVAEHPEHGRAAIWVEVPAALVVGGLKSLRVEAA